MNDSYFPHDFNARNSEDILKMFQNEGLEGIGLFWLLIEMLYETDGWMKLDYKDLCFNLRLSHEKIPLIKKIINDYELFEITDGNFSNPRVRETLKFIKEKSEIGKKGAAIRWGKKCHRNAEAMPPQCEGNAIKQDKTKQDKTKQKENKEKKKKELSTLPSILQNLKGFPAIWDDWIRHRSEIKKPLTSTTAKLQIKFLLVQPNPVACIEKAIRSGWIGLFALKENELPDLPYEPPKISESERKDREEFEKLPIEEQERRKREAPAMMEAIIKKGLSGTK